MIENKSVRDHFLWLNKQKRDIAEIPYEELDAAQKVIHRTPIDVSLVRIELVRFNKKLMCLTCGSPKIDESVSPYECKNCWMARVKRLHSPEESETLFDELLNGKMKIKVKIKMKAEEQKSTLEEDEEVPEWLKE